MKLGDDQTSKERETDEACFSDFIKHWSEWTDDLDSSDEWIWTTRTKQNYNKENMRKFTREVLNDFFDLNNKLSLNDLVEKYCTKQTKGE